MSSDVFLIPVDVQMFSETVSNPVSTENLPSQFTQPTRIWGIRDSELNRQFYAKLDRGDILVFYNGGQYIGVGIAGEKFQSSEFTDTYWGEFQAELLFEVDAFDSIEMPVENVNAAFEYEPTHIPQSLRRVSNTAHRTMCNKLGSADEFEKLLRTENLTLEKTKIP